MNNSKTINSLDDNMLIQILFRLPSYPSVLTYSLVSKRWCSLISDPKFAAQFSNHKKESSALSKPGSNIDDDEPPWSFIAKMDKFREHNHRETVGNISNNEAVFGSPKFSMGYLEFLHWDFKIEATFMDLVVCSRSRYTFYEGDQVYYITNPVTKQWVALPPCPVPLHELIWSPWVALVCQHPYGHTQDYKFRLVLIKDFPPPVYGMMVYCSEIGEWKKFNLSVPINRELTHDERNGVCSNRFEGVVCNGIIYLYQRLFFVAFNPFDVDETTNTTTIEAKLLPSLSEPYPIEGYLRESSGQLFVLHNPNKKRESFMGYIKHGRAIKIPLKVWKLDLNLVPLIWKMTFEGSFTGNVNELEPRLDGVELDIRSIGMHPKNDKLIYMYLVKEGELVMCDTRTGLIKSSKSLSGYQLRMFHRLTLQWWPTPVPKVYLSNASR